MSRHRSLLWFTALVLAVAGAPASAQDSLESIIKSPTLSRAQRATMEAEISVRVKRLADAGANDARRADARERILRTAQIKGASPAGLDAYAEICASELVPLLTNPLYEMAQDATLLLTDLNNPNTVRAFAVALESKYAAVRLIAARGIQTLHKKLADRQSDCEDALTALGKAGAAERNEHALRVIYQAINFPADVPNFKYKDSCAAALNAIFDARIQQLHGGSHDEQRDAEGLTAAAACYAGASPDQKARLMGHLVDFLQLSIDRYFDPDTGEESLPLLADAVDRIETVIYGMMKQSNVTPPSSRMAGKLKSKVSDRKKLETEIQASLKELHSQLEKEPWKLS